MATRNMTATYKTMRATAAATATSFESSAMLAYDTRPLVQMESRTPDEDLYAYLTGVHEVVKTALQRLKQLKSKRFLCGFGDEDEVKRDSDIDAAVTSTITEQLNTVHAVIKARVARVGNTAVTTVQRNMCRGFVAKFLVLQTELRRLQTVQRCDDGERKPTEADIDMGFTYAQQMEVVDSEVVAEQRGAEIQAICRDVDGLATLFKDLFSLIMEQGIHIDRIDYNIQEAHTRVTAGVKNVVQTEANQKKGFGAVKKCMVLLVFLIAVAIVVLLVRKA